MDLRIFYLVLTKLNLENGWEHEKRLMQRNGRLTILGMKAQVNRENGGAEASGPFISHSTERTARGCQVGSRRPPAFVLGKPASPSFKEKDDLTISETIIFFPQRKCMLLGEHFGNRKFRKTLIYGPEMEKTEFSNYMKIYQISSYSILKPFVQNVK